jgi:hypothetical protein
VSAGLKGDVIDVTEATTGNVVGPRMISGSCTTAVSEADYGFVVSQFRSRMRSLTFRSAGTWWALLLVQTWIYVIPQRLVAPLHSHGPDSRHRYFTH